MGVFSSTITSTYDPPGIGGGQRTTDPAAFELDRVVDCATDLLDHLAIGRAHIVGLSMSGAYGLWLTGAGAIGALIAQLAARAAMALVRDGGGPCWIPMRRWSSPTSGAADLYVAPNAGQLEDLRTSRPPAS
jgi:pimeloyl-ACP methyl ester carboxylesterase